MSTIGFRGSINRDNYLRALRLSSGQSRETKIFGGLFAALLFAFTVVGPLATGASIRPWLPVWVVALLIAIVFVVLPRLGIERALKTNKLLQEPIEGTAAEDAIRLTTSLSSATLPWGSFYQVKASPRMVLLYQASNLYNMFPREFFEQEEDWQTFRSWALEKVPTQVKKPRRFRTLLLWMAIFILVVLFYSFFRGD
jgi:hypothetical protein